MGVATESGGIAVFPSSSLTPPSAVSLFELSFGDREVEAQGGGCSSVTEPWNVGICLSHSFWN